MAGCEPPYDGARSRCPTVASTARSDQLRSAVNLEYFLPRVELFALARGGPHSIVQLIMVVSEQLDASPPQPKQRETRLSGAFRNLIAICVSSAQLSVSICGDSEEGIVRERADAPYQDYFAKVAFAES